jgi:osmotically-inducible protein OsmY
MRRAYLGERDTEAWPDDEGLHRLISDAIQNDAAFWTGRGSRKDMIVVEVDEGYVTLTGIVRTAVERRRADIIARALGAIGVDNRLQLELDMSDRSI